MKHLVVGGGQVGTAIALLLKDNPENEVVTIDIKDDAPCEPFKADVMHVCIPYNDAFEDAVKEYRWEYSPDLILVHSTVPVGTSRRLDAVHSPVTGVHPFLYESLKIFVKFFGGAKAEEAATIFDECDIGTFTTPNQETTEAGKLWQTLQYGYMIALQKEAKRFMDAVGADYDIAYEVFNNEYSLGYMELGLDYRLPILKDMLGPIGGHCVIPNLELTDSPMATFLEAMNDGWKADAIDPRNGDTSSEQAGTPTEIL